MAGRRVRQTAPISASPMAKPRKPMLATRAITGPARRGLRRPAMENTCGAMHESPAPRHPKPITAAIGSSISRPVASPATLRPVQR